MAVEINSLNTQNIVQAYENGASLKTLCRRHGVDFYSLRSMLVNAGITIRPRHHVGVNHPIWKCLPVERIAKQYLNGFSEARLARQYGVSRNVIRLRLNKSGVTVRGRSQAERLKWRQMTADQRASQVRAAHDATRGQPLLMSSQLLRAQTNERQQTFATSEERRLRSWLEERGVKSILQQAIGPYNCDLGAFPVAVEIFGGNWHWHGRHLLRSPQRFRYILDAGWHVIVIHVEHRRWPLGEGCADYLATYHQRVCRDPSMLREYRVIRGTGELVTAGNANDKEISIIPAFRRR